MAVEYESQHFRCVYRNEQGVLFVTYRGVLTPDVTRQFYQWLGTMIATRAHDLAGVKGSVYDFRDVTNFDNRNLTTLQRESQNLNEQVDVSNHPVALLVKTKLQEQLVRVAQKVSPQQTRKRIVFSEKAALDFIDEFLKTLEQNKPEEKV